MIRPLVALLVLPAGAAAQENKVEFQSITVKPGDTLWSVAQTYLEDPARWDVLLQHNTLPANDPTVALPGMTLRVPIRVLRKEHQAGLAVYILKKVLYKRQGSSEWAPVTENMQLIRNDTVGTMEGSRLVVEFLDKEIMQVEENSVAVVAPTGKKFEIELKSGSIVAANKKIMMGGAVVTPATPDTIYTATVRADKTTTVSVTKGQAEVQSAGKTVSVGAGMATEFKPDLAPSIPFNIPDIGALSPMLSSFQTRWATLRSKSADTLRSVKKTAAGALGVPTQPGQRGAGDLAKDASSLKMLGYVSDYRIQCSRVADFSSLSVDKSFKADSKIRPEDIGLPPGRYWCRIATIDLLGEQKPFGTAKLYSF